MQTEFTETDERRIRRIIDETNYDSPDQFIRRAVRRRLTALESEKLPSQQLKGDLFEYEITPGDEESLTSLSFQPKSDSRIRIKYFSKGDPPNTALMFTENTYIGADEIEDEMTGVDGVNTCLVPNTTGDIRFTIAEDNDQPIKEVIESIRDALYEFIREREERVENGEETEQDAKRRALQGYWEYAHQIGR